MQVITCPLKIMKTEFIASFTMLPHGVVAPFKEELFHIDVNFMV